MHRKENKDEKMKKKKYDLEIKSGGIKKIRMHHNGGIKLERSATITVASCP